MPGRGSDSRSASGLRPRLSQQVIAMAVIAQLVARRSHNPKVVSSILTRRICMMSLALPRSEFRRDYLQACCHGFVTHGPTAISGSICFTRASQIVILDIC